MSRRLESRRLLVAPGHYVIEADGGGSEVQWAFEIISESAKRFYHVDVLTGDLRNGCFPSNVSVCEVDKGRKENFRRRSEALRFLMRYTLQGMRLTRRDAPDVLHHVLPWGKTTFNFLILGRGKLLGIPGRTKVVMGPLQTPHELAFPEDDQASVLHRTFDSPAVQQGRARKARHAWPERVAERLCLATLRKADALIAVTEDAEQMLVAMGARAPIHVIPTGIRPERFPYVDRNERGSAFRVLSACYLVKRKGIDLVLQAISTIRNWGLDISLTLAGDGPERLNLERQIEALRLQDVVRVVGFVENSALAPLYASADVFVSMSWAESFGVSVIEAMSSGLPVISAANLGARNIIEDGVTGLLVPPGDHRRLAVELKRLAQDFAARRRIGDAARALVLQRFDWAVIGKQYEQVYESLF